MGVDSHFKMKEDKDHDAKENKPQSHKQLIEKLGIKYEKV
jgi:hypothetical protein